ncbi:MAG: hypothetical protein ABI232_03070 [Jatrophihabitantaceae bacterium]
MSGQTNQKSSESTLISASDTARMAAEQKMHDEWNRRTVRVVASAARDVDDCRMLLSILGLSEDIARAARTRQPNSSPKKSARPRAHAAA